MARAADALIEMLAAHGVDRIFALSGNQIMPLFDACLGAGIRLIHTRHEAATVYMAEAHAQLTGQIGVALVTAGAGFGNAVGALTSARASDTPVLLLSGDAPISQRGRGAFQEMDQCAVAATVTKATHRTTDPARLASDAAELIATALSDRPGPVHLALPVDVTTAQVPEAEPPTITPQKVAPTAADIALVQAAIDQAKAPLILTGPSLSATRHPALTLPRITMESPRGLSDPAHPGLAHTVASADLIVALGKPVDFTLGLGDPDKIGPARWISVSTDADQQAQAAGNLGERLSLQVQCDPVLMARAIAAPERSQPEASTTPPKGLNSHSLCAATQARIATLPNTIAICDGGEFGQWAQAIIRTGARIINGPSGAIGAGIPYAIAAKCARPDTAVFAFMGDGTSGFHLGEFETANRENIPFVAIIGNDQRWNAEHLIQARDFGPDRQHNCTLSNARYDRAVEALGGHGEHVTNLAQLDAALTRAIASQKPACINVDIKGLPAPTHL